MAVVPDQYARDRVVTEDLAYVLRHWLDAYEAERPGDATVHEYMGGTRLYESALKHLTRMAKTDPRRIWSILNEETRTTSLWLADRLLTPIDLSYTLYDGHIRVLLDFGARVPVSVKRMSNEEWYAYLEKRGYCV
jgi:hypothetical protein